MADLLREDWLRVQRGRFWNRFIIEINERIKSEVTALEKAKLEEVIRRQERLRALREMLLIPDKICPEIKEDK